MGISGVALKKADLIEAITKSEGIIVTAAEIMDCSFQSIHEWIARDEDVKKAVEAARDKHTAKLKSWDMRLVDAAYRSADRLINDGNDKLVTFTLERKGGWLKEEKQNLVQQIAYRIHKDE